MRVYKGTDKDMKCHEFQYALGETYKPDTWYKLENGEIVEVKE